MSQCPALEEFLQWESQSWVEAVADLTSDEKEYFMPLDQLKTYFTADDNKKLNQILTEIFNDDFPPIDSELILRDHTAIFCILLRIGRGTYVEHFARYEELSDRRLPFDPSHPPVEFPILGDDPAFLQQFCECQRMYCVPTFDCHMLHKHFGRNRLLPIVYKESCGADGMANKFVVKIHGPNNKLLPASKTPQPSNPNSNTFILKRYSTKEGERFYTQEVNGFRSVKHTESIIKFYGSYIHGDDFNILLEYPDKGTLEEYFRRETPPSRGADIITFWEGLFALIKGIKAIHSSREGHHDVTTNTILVLSNGGDTPAGYTFKLADFGLKKAPTAPSTPPTDGEITQHATYNPPECYLPFSDGQSRRDSAKITWAADIWSLGCIYSEAAIWIADGFRGLEDYRQQRAAETDRILFKGGDCFHDGEKTLQCVLNAHAEIEDRLRRTDYITKEVLDSMVDEMLWEEDRPNAKALWRKAEMISSRARQRLTSNSSESSDLGSRPSSSMSRLPPRREPPNQPLPPIPRLSSIAERQYPPNVEKWRAQVTPGQARNGRFSTAPSVNSPPSAPPTVVSQQLSSSDSVSELDREISGSIASWQMEDTSSNASPITPFTSPHSSVYYDYAGRTPMQMRANSIRSQSTYQSTQTTPRIPPRGMSFTSTKAPSDYGSIAPSEAISQRAEQVNIYAHQSMLARERERELDRRDREILEMNEAREAGRRDSERDDAREIGRRVVERDEGREAQRREMERREREAENELKSPPMIHEAKSAEETRSNRSLSRAPSQAGSRRSVYSGPKSVHSDETTYRSHFEEAPVKSHKRMGGFSLFPSRSRQAATGSPDTVRDTQKTPTMHSFSSKPRSHRSYSTSSGVGSWAAPENGPPDYLSLNTCLEWKKAHKKTKKHSKVPPLPGANLLEGLKDRDHVFIIDDSASMTEVWPDVKRVFEALSYVVKGMSPDGTELFFTISFETWRRKDTFDLCTYLEKKKTNGSTNIAWRLNLQLELYRAKIWSTRAANKKLRPISFYILTNGEWGKGSDPKVTIKQTADLLMQFGMLDGQVTIEFISFAQSAKAMEHMNDLAKEDFGVDIVDCERWTGNVLKMLRGPIDKGIWANDSPEEMMLPSPALKADSLVSAPLRVDSIVHEIA